MIITVLVTTGCSDSSHSATRPTGQPIPPSIAGATASPSLNSLTEPWAAAQPPGSCDVTRSTPSARPPAPIEPLSRPVPWVGDWYGNDALWVRLPPTGVVPAASDRQQLSTKFPWWRTHPGKLTVAAQRLDGPTGAFHADVPDGYGDLGFQPTGLDWTAPGCWRITGTVRDTSLTFIVWVQRFAPA
jgi:hypothetical protein